MPQDLVPPAENLTLALLADQPLGRIVTVWPGRRSARPGRPAPRYVATAPGSPRPPNAAERAGVVERRSLAYGSLRWNLVPSCPVYRSVLPMSDEVLTVKEARRPAAPA